MVDVLGGDREALNGARAAKRLVSENRGSPSSIPASPTHAAEGFGRDRHFVGHFMTVLLAKFRVCKKVMGRTVSVSMAPGTFDAPP